MLFNLPDEVQTKIWNYYWEYQFSKVIKQINDASKLEYESFYFLSRHLPTIFTDYRPTIIPYLKILNNSIIEHNKCKGKQIISKINNHYLKFCSNDKLVKEVCRKVDDNFKYVCYYSICISEYNRYHVLYEFTRMR